MTDILPHITLETGDSPQHSIIWLHGLGADGEDFVPVAEQMQLPVAVRYIFPHAPMQPVTVNGGYVMRAWYDIIALDIGARQDEAGIRDSQAAIEQLIAQERQRGLPIFMAHGNADTIVPHSLGLSSAKKLIDLGYPLDWHEYAMPHSVCLEEIDDLARWLAQRLSQ